MCVCVCVCVWVLCECIDPGPCADAFAFIHGEDCMCAFDCANWSAALKSQKSWEDRILWTAHKVCNEYLSLFIFARFRYFNVSSPLLLWVSATCGAILRHATQKGEGRGGEARGGGVSQVVSAQQCTFIYGRVHGHFLAARRSVRQNSKEKKKTELVPESVWDDSLKVQNDSHFGSVLQNN